MLKKLKKEYEVWSVSKEGIATTKWGQALVSAVDPYSAGRVLARLAYVVAESEKDHYPLRTLLELKY
jgi:hypothetical protein